MQISSFTHTGMVRRNNEDCCLVIPPWSGLAIRKEACLLAVADGMGGQNAGEVASGMAIKSAAEWFTSNVIDNISVQLLEDMFSFINASVWGYAQEHSETSGMGTTLTLMLIRGEKAMVGHIGDSRLYRLRNNQFEQLTSDHSLVAEQVRMGKLTVEAARIHPGRHILSRVLGGRQFVVPDIFEIDLQVNDLFMLCSDGISGMLENRQIEKVLVENKVSCVSRVLVDAANRAGGKDNSTVVTFVVNSLPVTFPGFFSFERLAKILASYGNAGSV